jgi:hypothetical protein
MLISITCVHIKVHLRVVKVSGIIRGKHYLLILLIVLHLK